MQEFDITGPLPTGTTLLEASAGTGKTWTIAALVTRYVAEGEATLDQLLVVTFTRAASHELRDRVRRQLDEALAVLTDPSTVHEKNGLHQWLLDADDTERALRVERLTVALTTFDAATIATIHQFCQLVLRSLGVAGDSDPSAVLVDDLEQLTDEVVDDLYLARFSGERMPPWPLAVARQIAREVVDDPRALVEPRDALDEAPDSTAAARVRFAQDVLAEIDLRKRRLGVLSYNDLLSQLADALQEADSAARSRMRHRWKIALIDEFQDTDPVQWEVFERAFAGFSTLVLIGDPKQAIYAFRGGDIVTYLKAAELAETRQTLGTNYRSDAPLIEALQVMTGSAELGSSEIVVHPVRAAHTTPRLVGAGAPIRMRTVRRAEIGAGPRSKPRIDVWRTHVLTDMARDIKRLLTRGATFEGEPVRPGQVAVLASRRATLQAAQAALHELGVPAVVNAGGSVFHTPAATEWLTLLEAIEQPHRSDRVRAAALTSFFGVDAAQLDADLPRGGGQGTLTDELSEELRTVAGLLTTRGVAAVMEYAVLNGLTERVLQVIGGERTLTDLRHIGELLHKVAVSERLGVAGLLGWLRDQVSDEKTEVASERTRRLDSDAAAVQLVTIHGSKGLEYPVVYLPTLWDRWTGRDPEVALFHDAEGRRCRDVGGHSPYRTTHLERYRAEDAGESLRLLYVALTRAQSQVVAWYAPSNNTPGSPLHRMLLGRRPGDAKVPYEQALVPDDRLVEIFTAWRDAGAFQPEVANHPEPDATPLPHGQDDLSVRPFTREVDAAWRRTSYTSLSSAATAGHGDPVPALSEPEEVPEMADEETVPVVSTDPEHPELLAVPSPMADLPVGATFGSLVHAVLEHADPGAPDLHAELRAHVVEQLLWWPVQVDPDELASALEAVCTSPMGPLTGQRTLLDVPLGDRLRELEFELPLAGGDERTQGVDEVRLGDLAPLLHRHLPDGDPVRSYARQLEADPGLADQPLRGYLTGSIDLVARVVVDGRQRYVTVDYKTNWLGDLDAPLTAHSYRPHVLDEAMAHSDYPLQALLYTVVLHRYLRWRLPDYDPAEHLGGVLYLYLRGMCGPETPLVDGHPCGIFSWRAPVGLVEELSALLDGEAPVAAPNDGGSR